MQTPSGAARSGAPRSEIPDIREIGSERDGVRQICNERLYVQLLVYTECRDPQSLIPVLEGLAIESVLYLNVNDPRGIGLLFMTENPDDFCGTVRDFLNSQPDMTSMVGRPELTMIGRSYSSGYEQDLRDWLLHRPRRNALNPEHRWAIWYPLRRKPEFETLSREEQRAILMEHAKIGMGYGAGNLAHDIRLACHGLDENDNEFLLGIVSKDLYPLSRLVQDMRKTQQTSKYIQSLGPFFVGKVLWQAAPRLSS